MGPPLQNVFTFCKSCIVRHFYYSNRCPKCNIVVHQTQPLYNVRLDLQLQDIVYKLVISLEAREEKQRHVYKERGLDGKEVCACFGRSNYWACKEFIRRKMGLNLACRVDHLWGALPTCTRRCSNAGSACPSVWSCDLKTQVYMRNTVRRLLQVYITPKILTKHITTTTYAVKS